MLDFTFFEDQGDTGLVKLRAKLAAKLAKFKTAKSHYQAQIDALDSYNANKES